MAAKRLIGFAGLTCKAFTAYRLLTVEIVTKSCTSAAPMEDPGPYLPQLASHNLPLKSVDCCQGPKQPDAQGDGIIDTLSSRQRRQPSAFLPLSNESKRKCVPAMTIACMMDKRVARAELAAQDDGILDTLSGSAEALAQLFSPLKSESPVGSLQAGFVARVVTVLIVKRPVALLDWLQVSILCDFFERIWF